LLGNQPSRGYRLGIKTSVESYFCGVNHKRLSFSHVSCRPIECPLKPLPEEDHEDHYPDEWEDGEDAN